MTSQLARLLGALLFASAAIASAPAMAQNQTLQKQLNSGQATTIPVGGQVVYVIRGACNSLTNDCGVLSLNDTLPPELEVVSCTNQGNFFQTLNCAPGSGSITAIRNVFADGESYTLTITARARVTLTAAAVNVINNVRTGIVGQVCPSAPAALPANCVEANSPPIAISVPSPNYRVRKQRTDPAKPEANNGDPAAGLQIASNTRVTYRVQFCSNATTGNLALTAPVTLTDTFSAIPGVTVFNAGSGTVSGNSISWSIGQAELDSLLGTTNCISRSFTLQYPVLSIGTVVDNAVVGAGNDANGNPLAPGPLGATVRDEIGAPTPGASISKSGNDTTPPGSITWRLNMNNTNSNVPLLDFVVIDSLPRNPPSTSGPLNVTSIRSGAWPSGAPDYNVVADLYTTVSLTPGACNGANASWTLLSAGVANNANTLFTSPGQFPVASRAVCWRFRNTNVGVGLPPANETPRGFSFTTSPQIVQDVPGGTPLGFVENCIGGNWSGPGAAGSEGPTCRRQNIEVPLPAINPGKTRIAPNTGSLEPLQEFAYRLTFTHVGSDSTGDIVNPVVGDLLPANVEFLSWDAYNGPGSKPAPNLRVIDNYNGTGRTLLRFVWSATVDPSANQPGDAAPIANAASFETSIAGGSMPRMDISVRIRAGTPPGNGSGNPAYRNELQVLDNGATGFTCDSTPVVDVNDIDGDGNILETLCLQSTNFTVVQAAVLTGEKWIRGDLGLTNVDDPTDAQTPVGGICPDYIATFPGSTVGAGYTRFPCVAQTDHGAAFDYVLRVNNAGNQDLDNYVLYDVLPFVGDTGSGQPLATSPRNSSWRPLLTGPITVVSQPGAPAANIVIEYSTAVGGNFCRPEVSNNAGPGAYTRAALPLSPTLWQPGCDNTFTTAPADYTLVTGFRIRAYQANNFPVLGVLEFRVPMRAPTAGAPPTELINPAIFFPSWNSFAHSAFVADGGASDLPLPTAEPRKVGIVLPERYRIGNLVWEDFDNDGVAETGEPGIDGVNVLLCRDSDATAGPSAGDNQVGSTISATVGGQAGKYFFDTLVGGSNYYVAVPDQAALGARLSSGFGEEANPNGDADNNDNGIGTSRTSSIVCGGVNAVASGLITVGLVGSTEPSNEVLRSGSGVKDDSDPFSFPLPGSGFGQFPDEFSNLSIDFGFHLPADRGDLPDTGAGGYDTLDAQGGPVHPMIPTLMLGTCVDSEADGQPNAAADGDDTNAGGVTFGTCAGNDDEDGVVLSTLNSLSVFGPAQVQVLVDNRTGVDARVCGFIDFNNDGAFTGSEITSVTLPSAAAASTQTLNFGNVPSGSAGQRYARFRVSTDVAGACSADGLASDGEVEDYQFNVAEPTDFGDLPDGTPATAAGDYQTLLANNGPRHVIRPGLQIGTCVDGEGNGQPTASANGDDSGAGIFTQGTCAVANDDEDGLTPAQLAFQVAAVAQLNVPVINTTGAAGRLCAFVDWNRDGDFDDVIGGTPESAFVAVPDSTTGPVTVSFGAVSQAVVPGSPLFARLRLSTGSAACAATGVAADGEVEDYVASVTATDLGDLPIAYGTLLANSGAVHTIVPGIFLGASVDAELDGQPSVGADGDDLATTDDEDGVTFPGVNPSAAGRLIAGRSNPVSVIASAPGFLNCWFDFNSDGDFGDAGEQVANDRPLTAGGNGFTIAVPLSAQGSIYHRCRFTTGAGQATLPTGPASNGEVEDGVVSVFGADLGDLPDPALGTAQGDYQTRIVDGGAEHIIIDGLHFGASVDRETDGQPTTTADGDDANGVPDDEDGLPSGLIDLVAGVNGTITINARNQAGGGAANVCGFVDFNADGDFADAGESVGPIAVADGTASQPVALNFGNVPVLAATSTYARFRISYDAACAANGDAAAGEVEDYRVSITRRDFGDLPDTGPGVGPVNYRTLLADNGPYHEIIDGLFMGAGVDQEADGQPNAAADLDDTVGPLADDEDGVTLRVGGYELGSPARATVNATNQTASAALVCGYIDWNADGDFGDVSEAAQLPVPAGTVAQNFVLEFGLAPLDAIASTYGRFRLSTGPTCSPFGPAPDGEVEDYVVQTTTNGALSLGNLVWEDLNNNGLVDSGEPGVPAVPVTLFADADANCIPDGPSLGNQTTGPNGEYLFIDLLPGVYLVEIAPPPIFLGSTGTGRYLPIGPYEPAPDPNTDINNDDNGTQTGAVISSCGIELIAKTEPVDDGDTDFNSNLTVDFGLVRFFDLAIRKTLSPGQINVVGVGQTASFTITVFNQGTVPATNVLITDYIPTGMELADTAWTMVATRKAQRTLAGPIAAGSSISTTIVLRSVMPRASSYVNYAEISAASDDAGIPRIDIDSDPDDDLGNDGPTNDDAVDNEQGDEDDLDFATIGTDFVQLIPVDNPFALILLALVIGLVSVRVRRS